VTLRTYKATEGPHADVSGRKETYRGDIERRIGLPRYYISRVENGHMVHDIDTVGQYRASWGWGLLFHDSSAIFHEPSP